MGPKTMHDVVFMAVRPVDSAAIGILILTQIIIKKIRFTMDYIRLCD